MRVEGLGFRAQSLGVGVWGFGLGVSGSGDTALLRGFVGKNLPPLPLWPQTLRHHCGRSASPRWHTTYPSLGC